VSELARALLADLAADPVALDQLRELVDDGQGPEPWVGVARAAEHLGCKPQRIYDLVHQQAIPFHKDGSRLLFRLTELDAWLGKHRASNGVD
jgi:excisionase family DNA binding protein